MSPKGAIRLLRRSLKHSCEGFSISFNTLFYTNALFRNYVPETDDKCS